MPAELRECLNAGGHTALMVWADLDHDVETGDQLKAKFWAAAEEAGITNEEFERAVFAFAKDRLENWIEFLLTGRTDEAVEGPRQKHGRIIAEAAKTLAERCKLASTQPPFPPSLAWSCQNWQRLKARMQ
jgi:hypothetical protein